MRLSLGIRIFRGVPRAVNHRTIRNSSTDFGKFLRSPAARAVRKCMVGLYSKGVRNSVPFPRLSLRHFLRAKATHPAKHGMATQQRADFNSATAQCYLHDVLPPCCVFPDSSSRTPFFFRHALSS